MVRVFSMVGHYRRGNLRILAFWVGGILLGGHKKACRVGSSLTSRILAFGLMSARLGNRATGQPNDGTMMTVL
jgi:hypothetical protein